MGCPLQTGQPSPPSLDGTPLTLMPAVPDFDRIEVLTRQQKPSEAFFNERRGDED
jgi:hypothetical protein